MLRVYCAGKPGDTAQFARLAAVPGNVLTPSGNPFHTLPIHILWKAVAPKDDRAAA
jgi:hypothetical protein